MEDLKVIIVGASLAGLGVAQGLKKNNVNFVILEKEPAPRDRNWGVTISWSTPLIKQILPESLFARLKECQTDPELDSKEAGCEGVLVRDGATGETMATPHFPGVRRINVKKTRKLWSEGIDVKFGKSLTSIETDDHGVTVHFADGSVETGSVLVGCDGGSALARRILCGNEAAEAWPLGYEFLNFPFHVTAEQALYLEKNMHPIVDVGCHPRSMYVGVFLLDKPDLTRPETWVYYFLVTWPIEEGVTYPDKEDMLPYLRQKVADYGWADIYAKPLSWVSDDTRVRLIPGGLRVWSPREAPWNNMGGRATLAGDAAHAMTFHRGQGGNNAIKDAANFVSAMVEVKKGTKSSKEAVDMYDEEVRKRGVEEVEISSQQTHAFHDHANFMNSPIFKFGIKPKTDDETKKEELEKAKEID